MKHGKPNRLFALMAVAILITACCPKPTQAPADVPSSSGEVWTPAKDITVSVGGSSSSKLEIPAGTRVTPKSAEGKVDLEEISPSDIGTRLPDLPEGKKVLAAVDITPDGMTFSPPAPLHFALPRGHGYSAKDILEVMQLDKSSNQWLPAGEAEVDASEKFAVGEIAHTCVFALVESSGASTAAPVTASVSIASLFDELDSTLSASDYVNILCYFSNENEDETVDALTAYAEEHGISGTDMFQASISPDEDFGGAINDLQRYIATFFDDGPTLILLIDLSDSTRETIVIATEMARENYPDSGPFIVFRMDTYEGQLTQLGEY